MGFLSGVLGAVKDENEVTTYDKDDQNNINTVITTLTNNIGSGRTGLVEAVDAVRSWLEGYEKKLNEKINAVKKPINEILSDNTNENSISHVINIFKQLMKREYDEYIVSTSLGGMHRLPKQSTKIEQSLTALKNIDNDLKYKLTKHVESVEQAIEILKQNAANDYMDLREVCSKTDEQFGALNESVRKGIEDDGGVKKTLESQKERLENEFHNTFKIIQHNLTGELENMNSNIENLSILKTTEFKSIYEAVEFAREKMKVLADEFNTNYKAPIHKLFGVLKSQMRDIDPNDESVRGKNQSKLKEQFQAVKQKVQEIEGAYQEKLMTVYASVIAAVGKDEAPAEGSVLKALNDLDGCIKHGLKHVIDTKVKGAIETFFSQLGNAGFGNAASKGRAHGGIHADDITQLQASEFKLWLTQAIKDGLKSVKTASHNLFPVIGSGGSTAAVRAVLYSLEGLKEVMSHANNKSAFDSIGKDVGNAVDAAVGDIDTQLSTLMQQYHGQTMQMGNTNGELRDLIKHIKDPVEAYMDADRKAVDTDDSVEFPNYKSNKELYTNATVIIDRIVDTLENLPKAVDGAQQNAEERMITLKAIIDEIQGRISIFGKAVKKADAALEKLVGAVQHSLIKTEQVTTETLHKLRSQLLHTLNSAFQQAGETVDTFYENYRKQSATSLKSIKNDALKKFADTKAQELEDLKSFITDQLTKMTAIIETDAASGTKGLLRTMRTNHLTLSQVSSTTEFKESSEKLKLYLYTIFHYISTEVNPPSSPSPSSQLVADLQTRTHDLLTHLHENNRTFTFDSVFLTRLHALTSALSSFDPATFANPHHPQLLDALKAGMKGLVGEMEKAYVNRYDSQKIKWEELKGDKQETTVDAKRCAKVFMSCLPMLLNDLSKVKERCVERGEWSKKHLHIEDIVQNGRKPKNPLGTFFRDCGYKVPTSQTSKQDGELQCRHVFSGKSIYDKLVEKKTDEVENILKHVKDCDSNYERGERKKEDKFDIFDILSCLFEHLGEYYQVNHYATFNATKHPSSIYDMLLWLSGLTYNAVYSDLALNGFEALFEEPKETDAKANNVDILVEVEKERSLEAYPTPINVNLLSTSLRDVCHHAEETLISFLGHGHSGGIYACDFNTNTAKLTYPSDPSKCIDLLFEVIGRVYNQLFFLFKQCSYRTTLGGWYDCWYGQGVGGSAWNCNTLQCPGQSTNQQADQEQEQKCNQSCDQSAECGLKSPLQSFLEDGLPGFLPHPYSKSDCKPTCSAPGHFGKVCITPMGFNDISGMASRRQQGRHIMDVLREFCGSEHAPLSRLCGLLTCLLTRPPQTLGDMFAFYYNFLNGWHSGSGVRENHREIAYSLAVKDANFKNNDNPLEVHSMFKSIRHKSKHGDTHLKGDLYSLVACDKGMAKDTYCGRYLQPCGQHIWTVFSEKHAGNYLSWIVYLTETFYDLLKMLYDDCNNKCGQDHSKCNRTSCAVDCKTKLPSEPKTPIPDKYHNSDCRTIVTCKSTLPTFCRYGFVFDKPEMLYGEYGSDKKRTCKDFCNALKRVLSVVKDENDVLAKLKFDTIPTFLWNIRSKFFWTTVTLWLLSFLYLLHIMVIRLDLLHIKSHLHSPSSHRIAAQSLLAAARVNKLNRVFYLQP